MLLGQLDGSYALVATSSLGIESGAATFLALTDTPNSLSTGSLVYANAPDSLAELPISSNGLVLKLQGGLPVWAFDLRAHRAEAAVNGVWSISDARYKENISTTTSGLDLLRRIPVYDFILIGEADRRQQGFIAQELYQYYPEAVTVG